MLYTQVHVVWSIWIPEILGQLTVVACPTLSCHVCFMAVQTEVKLLLAVSASQETQKSTY